MTKTEIGGFSTSREARTWNGDDTLAIMDLALTLKGRTFWHVPHKVRDLIGRLLEPTVMILTARKQNCPACRHAGDVRYERRYDGGMQDLVATCTGADLGTQTLYADDLLRPPCGGEAFSRRDG